MSRFLTYILIFCTSMAFGQEEMRYGEGDINLQNEFMEAYMELQLGRYEEATSLFKELYKKDRNNAAVAYNLARAYAAQEDYENAERYADIAVKKGENNHWYILFHANMMMDFARYDEAAESFKKLRTNFPDNYVYTENLSFCYLKLNQVELSITVLDEWEKEHGTDEKIIKRKFEIYDKLGKNKEAAEELKKLTAKFPQNIRHHHNLANYYNRLEKEKDAIQVYKKILELNPDDGEARAALLLYEKGEAETELGYLAALVKKIEDPNRDFDDKIKTLIPFVNANDENNNAALSDTLLVMSTLLVSQYPDEAKAHALLADVFMSRNEQGKAIEEYVKTLDLDDRVFTVWEQLMYALDMEASYELLADKSYEAIDLFPNKAVSYYYYGKAKIHTAEYEEASELLEEGVLIAGKDIVLKSNIYHLLGRIGYLKQDMALAKEHTEKSLEISNQKNPKSLELMGDILFQMNEHESAFEYWKKSLATGNNSDILKRKIEEKQLIE